ncbi:MAG: type II toxin-antitoxin system HicA family toxin [Elusimicrobia bacterium]|nr:type II toxin-antitoxin system HicA family toxin [Elusimicrobiota bacterium]
MGRLPSVSGKDAVRALGKEGFRFIRQSGSHLVLQKALAGSTVTVIVPNHPELARGTLRAIIRKSGLSVDDFIALL